MSRGCTRLPGCKVSGTHAHSNPLHHGWGGLPQTPNSKVIEGGGQAQPGACPGMAGGAWVRLDPGAVRGRGRQPSTATAAAATLPPPTTRVAFSAAGERLPRPTARCTVKDCRGLADDQGGYFWLGPPMPQVRSCCRLHCGQAFSAHCPPRRHLRCGTHQLPINSPELGLPCAAG